MASVSTRWSELTQFVTHHVFGDVDRYVAAAIMHSNGMSYHLREDRAGTAPSTDNGFLIFIIQLLNFFEELRAYERPFFQ